MACGIYEIRNKHNGKVYIGSSKNIKLRYRQHYLKLIKGKHCNIILQRAWNKYGEDLFEFNTLIYTSEEVLIKVEQWYLDYHQPYYNIRLSANSSAGLKFTKEHRNKMSASQKGLVKLRSPQGLINNRVKRRLHSSIAKLNESKVINIKKMLSSKLYTQQHIADKHNVHQGTIASINTGKTWKDVKI